MAHVVTLVHAFLRQTNIALPTTRGGQSKITSADARSVGVTVTVIDTEGDAVERARLIGTKLCTGLSAHSSWETLRLCETGSALE